MIRREIAFRDYATEIVSVLPRGVLLTTKANDRVNSMVIGWGTLGVNWGKPMFAVYVREGRYTRELLDANPEFVVSVPIGSYDPNIIKVCGTRSGRNEDKIASAGLTLVDGLKVSVPAIREFPLTVECRVLYRQAQDLSFLRDDGLKSSLYPQGVDSSNTGINSEVHVSYYGEVLASYIIE